jgi:hypothetical protein
MTPKQLKSLMHRTRASSEMLGPALGIAPAQIRKWRRGARKVPAHHINRMRVFFAERAAKIGIDPPTLPEIPELVDLGEIAPAAAEEEELSAPAPRERVRRPSRLPRIHRRRAASGDPKPAISTPPGRTSTSTPAPPTAGGGATLIEAINAALAPLLRRETPATVRRAAPRSLPSPPSLPSSLPLVEISPPMRLIVPVQSRRRRQTRTIEALALGPPPQPFTPPRGPRCAFVSTAPGEQGRCGQIAAPGSPLCAMHHLQSISHRR